MDLIIINGENGFRIDCKKDENNLYIYYFINIFSTELIENEFNIKNSD